jgi:soluble lytic murein transglycosylase-like protein
LSAALLIYAAFPAHACWDEAAMRYQVSSELLYAVARTESSLNPVAVNRNSDGSVDIGLMQINSRWLPTLARYGIGSRELLEPCTNIQVGAWVLAQKIRKLGVSWVAVGAYNANSPVKRIAYARKVYQNLPRASGELQQ